MEKNCQIEMPSWQVHRTNLHANTKIGRPTIIGRFHGSPSLIRSSLSRQYEKNRRDAQKQLYHKHIEQSHKRVAKDKNRREQGKVRTVKRRSKRYQTSKMENIRISDFGLNWNRQAFNTVKTDSFGYFTQGNLNEAKHKVIIYKIICFCRIENWGDFFEKNSYR